MYRNLRLKALKTDPLAFASTFREDSLKSDNIWQENMQKSILAAAEIDNKLVGMMLAYIYPKSRLRHWAELHGVYVMPEFRGQKIASQMLEKLIAVLKKKKIMKLKLAVVEENQAAVKLYKKFGFRIVGKLEKENYFDGKYYDEIIMEKFI